MLCVLKWKRTSVNGALIYLIFIWPVYSKSQISICELHSYKQRVRGLVPVVERSRPCKRGSWTRPSTPRPLSERSCVRELPGPQCRACGRAQYELFWNRAWPPHFLRTAIPDYTHTNVSWFEFSQERRKICSLKCPTTSIRQSTKTNTLSSYDSLGSIFSRINQITEKTPHKSNFTRNKKHFCISLEHLKRVCGKK